MLKDDIKKIKSSTTELKKFGILMFTVLFVLGGFLLWRERPFYIYIFPISILFLLTGLIRPALLEPVYKAWMTLAVSMGWVMTRVILSIMFYLIFTPISLISKVLKKKYLSLGPDKTEDSYWIYKDAGKKAKSNYERQF